PFRIILGCPMLAAVVEEIAARFLGERMHEQLALCVPGRDDTAHRLEVLLRRLVAPRVAAGIERLQTQRRAGDVTRDAARVAGASTISTTIGRSCDSSSSLAV